LTEKILFITHGEPLASGHGGNHRTYQIYYELCQLVGESNVIILRPIQKAPESKVIRTAYFAALFARNAHSNILGAIARTNFAKLMAISSQGDKNETHETLRKILQTAPPVASVVESPIFYRSVNFLKQNQIPVVAAFQNLESLDTINPTKRAMLHTSIGADFGREIGLLSRYDHRLFISKIETALIGGVGLSSTFYPYTPVGKIFDYFQNIKRLRSQTPQTVGLFAMIGSAFHPSTYEGMRWFVECAVKHGLPENAHVVIAGRRTESFAGVSLKSGTIEAVGKISSDNLTKLLVEAQAVLVPHFRGFGGLTKLPEISLAGIPILASKHVTYAVNSLPHLLALEDSWQSWTDQMSQVINGQLAQDETQELPAIDSELYRLLQSIVIG